MTKLSSSIYLGIDTGGTYTDGVLFDPHDQTVLKSMKVLTTHHDLKICISEIVDHLIPEDPSVISFVSLSTTLATNAIAEGKRKTVALLLLGYDPDLVHQFNFQQQFGTNHYFFVQGRHDLNGIEQIPLDEAEITRITQKISGKVDAFAVSSFAGPANSSHEKRAAEIITGLTPLQIIQAHHLSSELDSIRRASTASLNASLLTNLQDLLDAVQEMLAQRGVKCPLMMARGDGSIVKDSFARQRPVEMIHSGSATSAIGGQYLAGADTALVIDIGGTTTDITLVDRGQVQIQEEAAIVGSYRTCVKTIKARSFGLGGDSLIAFNHWKSLSVGPERVVPISRICSQYAEIKQDLFDRLEQKQKINYADEIEYWILRREPIRPVEDKQVGAIIDLLRHKPQNLWGLKKKVGPIAPILIRELIDMEIIDRAGLTPTDLLHVTGEFTPWDCDSAGLVTEIAARNWDENTSAFIQRVRKLLTYRIVFESIQFLSDRRLSESGLRRHNHRMDCWLYEESLNGQDSYLGCSIFLKIPIVGVGAAARTFLPPVADAMKTAIIFPENYEVANAVGAVVGNVVARQEGEVFPCVEGSVITGYFARVVNRQEKFVRFEEALSFARETLTQHVAEEVRTAGAETALVECIERKIWEGMVHLYAWAVGKPSLNGKTGENLGISKSRMVTGPMSGSL
jgi:N-methylhydantoinase A/oxoprolinase/acetone carboxylase beta subunit